MSEDFGPTFITVTDEDGKELVLEFVDALEYNGQMYQAFFPAETEGENEDDPDNGLVILKVIHEDGEDLLSTLDSDEELEAYYQENKNNLDTFNYSVFTVQASIETTTTDEEGNSCLLYTSPSPRD